MRVNKAFVGEYIRCDKGCEHVDKPGVIECLFEKIHEYRMINRGIVGFDIQTNDMAMDMSVHRMSEMGQGLLHPRGTVAVIAGRRDDIIVRRADDMKNGFLNQSVLIGNKVNRFILKSHTFSVGG